MKKLIAICAVIILLGRGYAKADTWTNIDIPGANLTFPQGVSGSNVVGYYLNESGNHGFLYSTTTQSWATIDRPGAAETYILGINDSNMVGCYWDGTGRNDIIENPKDVTFPSGSGHIHSFSYNMTTKTWTTLDMPGATEGSTIATGISGNNIVGYYRDKPGYSHGFLYNGTTWTTLDMPTVGVERNYTYSLGVNATHVVGCFRSSAYGYHGFLYNIATQKWTILDMPKRVTMLEDSWPQLTKADNEAVQRLRDKNVKPEDKLVAFPQGVSGSNVVGYYSGDSGPGGFIYNMTTQSWNIIGQPGVEKGISRFTENTHPQGIDGNNIVGTYFGQQQHGFLDKISTQ